MEKYKEALKNGAGTKLLIALCTLAFGMWSWSVKSASQDVTNAIEAQTTVIAGLQQQQVSLNIKVTRLEVQVEDLTHEVERLREGNE